MMTLTMKGWRRKVNKMIEENVEKLAKVVGVSKKYSSVEIESSVVAYLMEASDSEFCYENNFSYLEGKANEELIKYYKNIQFPIDLEFLVEFFESLLDEENINENGIVFTPKYIADYISVKAIENHKAAEDFKAIDPGCGCGIFLISFAEQMHNLTGKTYKEIVSNNIFGFDIDEDNARRCEIVLNLLVAINKESNEALQTHIKCADALKSKWNEEFNVDHFDYIIGNPPYVNTHDMSKETAKFLKETFLTTKVGVYNIFYAFVEHAMKFVSEDGVLSYIVPNNFLSIKSATDLRRYISEHRYLESIIDFADNMIFKPVRTYNCIIRLSKQKNDIFEYCVLEKCEDIKKTLNLASFEKMEIEKLDLNGWKLVDKVTLNNIHKIENQFRSIKEFVRTGIATLRDDVFIVDQDENGFYKAYDGKRYDIEEGIVKRLYKIPDLKACEKIEEACRYIIFPYVKSKSGFALIEEKVLEENYPKTYEYLKIRKPELDERDKGKPNPAGWFAYGRTQGLAKYGKKLVFPTFAFIPRFTMVEDEYALFCNGYAVFENDYIDLDVIQRILNSKVMQYYVSNTSYAIEGGYYCYQKKYIEKFSLPFFSDYEISSIKDMSTEDLDDFLIQKYDLAM